MAPHALSRQTFVLQRRIPTAYPQVERVLNSDTPPSVELIDLPSAEPFEVVTAWPYHSWRSRGLLRDPDGGRVASVEIELGPWSADATELLLRPAALHPERWSARRQRQYFRVAHAAADDLAAHLEARGRLVAEPSRNFDPAFAPFS
jgi:hypothetical protein